ncbi:MAG: hypothetical protein ABIK89_05770 [Planctomycetota bacterium]
MKTTLTVEIEYDPDITDPEALACAMDRLLETAMSTPGILDEVRRPRNGRVLHSEQPYHGDLSVPRRPKAGSGA